MPASASRSLAEDGRRSPEELLRNADRRCTRQGGGRTATGFFEPRLKTRIVTERRAKSRSTCGWRCATGTRCRCTTSRSWEIGDRGAHLRRRGAAPLASSDPRPGARRASSSPVAEDDRPDRADRCSRSSARHARQAEPGWMPALDFDRSRSTSAPAQFKARNLADAVRDALQAGGPGGLASLASRSPRAAFLDRGTDRVDRRRSRACTTSDVLIALDDFGTGYLLHGLPAQLLRFPQTP